jgi:hypothetical protein
LFEKKLFDSWIGQTLYTKLCEYKLAIRAFYFEEIKVKKGNKMFHRFVAPYNELNSCPANYKSS